MATLNDVQLVNGQTSDVSQLNKLLGGILRSEFTNPESLSATKTLADSDMPLQRLNCNGADRIVKLPTANTTTNHLFVVVNSTSSGNYTLTVQNNGATINHAILAPSEAVFMTPDGNGGYEPIGRPFSRVLSPSQITANQNDYYPTGAGYADVIRLSSDASRNITGLAFVPAGKPVLLFNVGSYNIVLINESASSTAANRIACVADYILQPNKGVLVWYDATTSRVRVLNNYNYETAYKITPSVASNNLTVTLTHADGTAPSTSRPLWFLINGQYRAAIGTLSIVLNAGTQYFALGAAFAAKEQQLFCYVSWIAASSAVGFHFARMPYGSVYSDFSSTNTNEKYLASTSAPASTDDLANIGRFSITLGASASYNWSQPTYTSANLKQYPIYETDWLNWAPAPTGYSSVPPTVFYQYKWEGKDIRYFIREATTDGTSNAVTITMTAPFTALTLANAAWVGVGALGRDNGAGLTTTPIAITYSASATINFFKDPNGAAWTNVNGKRIGYLEGRYPVAA